MFKDASDFIRDLEYLHPLGSHENFKEGWKEDIQEFIDAAGFTEEQLKEIDAVIEFRLAFAAANPNPNPNPNPNIPITQSSWKWLLTADQVEQRTPKWYAETRNLLTASEVGKLFEGPGARNSLVKAKSGGQRPEAPLTAPRLAVLANETGPMDWGTRYEAVVKAHLEKSLQAKIVDLGRIKHRTYPTIAASPDGLIISSEADSCLVGRLVEIKCPLSRVIGDNIPFEYWCQMQWQMEVCDVNACEFVEAKIRQLGPNDSEDPVALDRGWITLQNNTETDMNRYIYNASAEEEGPWINLEKYQWELMILRRVTLVRDSAWFQNSQPIFEAFWRDVEAARSGTWQPTPVKARKAKAPMQSPAICAIVDDSLDLAGDQLSLGTANVVLPSQRDEPEPTHDTI